MTSSQKNRSLLLIITLLITVVLLAPTVFKSENLPDWWPAGSIKLGLDLRGGSYLVLGVQTEEAVKSRLATIASEIKSELRKKKAGVIRARQIGAADIEITLLGDRGRQETEDYVRQNFSFLKLLDSKNESDTVKLSFRIDRAKAEEIKQSSVDQAIETIRNRVDQFGVAEPLIQKQGSERIMVQLPDVQDVSGVKKTIGSVAKLEFQLVSQDLSAAVGTRSLPSRSGGNIRVEDEVLMTGDAIDNANVEINPSTNEIEVTLRLNSVGAKTFERITSENVQRQLAIILDGVVQSSPVIRDRIGGGTAVISGGFTPDEANKLSIVLRSGALPAPLTFEEERTVGASLGADSINKGIISTVIGTVIVIIFMIFYYRRSGILAVGCLILNMLFLLALLSLFGATLTLPGIAGLALTVGMAVDANVIIFERIKEELRTGASSLASIEAGFAKAHWTIMDSNITTLITGLILYGFGTGPIKGFAVTLCLGILTSVFSALFVAKLGFDLFKFQTKKNTLSI